MKKGGKEIKAVSNEKVNLEKKLKNELTEEQKQEIKDAFDLVDADGSGNIEIEEMKLAMKALGFDPKKDEVKNILDQLDRNKDGVVSFEEFLDLITSRMVFIN